MKPALFLTLLLFFCHSATANKEGFSQSVLMGHSYFMPGANDIKVLAPYYGYTRHTQFTQGGGGTNGDPGSLWRDTGENEGAKAEIKKGTTEVLGLTLFSLLDGDSEYEDYKQWIDFTLQHNPDTFDTFFIMIPWASYANNPTYSGNRASQDTVNEYVHDIIQQLRVEYPQLTCLAMPVGEAMSRLWRLYDEGQLGPEILGVKQNGNRDNYLQYDNIGHAGKIMEDTLGLIWQKTLYPETDIRTVADPPTFQHDWTYDIRQLAYEIWQDELLAHRYKIWPVADGSFENPTNVVGSWGMCSAVWNDTGTGQYEVGEPGHLSSAVHGNRSALMSTMGTIHQELGSVTAGDTLTVVFYGGRGASGKNTDAGGVFNCTFKVGGASHTVQADTTQLAYDTWEAYTNTWVATETGTLTLEFSNVSGKAWIDHISDVVVGLVIAPTAPTGLTVSPGDAEVDLSWNASAGATSYNVKRATSPGGSYTTIGSPTGTSYNDGTALNGTTYYYVVSAVNAGGESTDSSEVSATPWANDYAAWIAGYPAVGVQTGFTEDPDGDGLDTGVESVLGSDPSAFNAGLVLLPDAGSSATFTHTESNAIPSDVSLAYQWSTDLAEWKLNGETNSGGVKVSIAEIARVDNEAPDNDLVTMSAAVDPGGTQPAGLFLRIKVEQAGP